MRLDRVLSNLNYGSRNDIKDACKNKRVMVNNNVVKDSSVKIEEKDIIKTKYSLIKKVP